MNFGLIIPALNEEKSIKRSVEGLPQNFFSQIIVVDNNSSDRTADKAREAGAQVVSEKREGYGQACLSGIDALASHIDVVVFMDADLSDDPQDLPALVEPIRSGKADFSLGSRIKGEREAGSLTLPQVFGSWLSGSMINLFWGFKYSDLGPFRAITRSSLDKLGMQDRDFGWTVEMQIKAIQKNLKIVEVPVRYRNRVGISKISGTLKGVVMAGTKIIYTILRYRVLQFKK